MTTNATAAQVAEQVAYAIGLRVWTAGRNQVAPEGTRVIHRGGTVGDVSAIITTDGRLVTGLDRAAREVPAELVEAYLMGVADRHCTSQQRRDVLAYFARRAGVELG